MALDRQSIERRDFPIARRGYEIEAVDGHLRMLADEYEALDRRGRSASAGSLAASASDQVRAIVEAAEQSAIDIGREAELEARQVRQDAREEAERLRADAGRRAREHVTRVADVAKGLLDRVESMDRELGGLLEGLRSGTQRLSADLSLLQSSVGEVREAAHAAASALPEPTSSSTPPADARAAPTDAAPGPPSDPQLPPEVPVAAPSVLEPVDPAHSQDDGPANSADDAEFPPDETAPELAPGDPAQLEHDGARMVALNMALNGVAREETERHLAQNFELHDVEDLLDDVYARAGQ